MGTSRWDATDWASYSKTTSSKSTSEIFRSRNLNEDLDPKGINRESRDSDENPESTAIIVGCDVTGSMGMIAENLIREGLGVLFEEIYDRKPVSDPHIMVTGIGDVDYDSAPLQVSQFEADLTIASALEKMYIEHGGGGNNHESYDMPMHFAAYHTSIDCFEKRGKKGYLFTIGDELPPTVTSKRGVEEFIGDDGFQEDIPFEDTVEAAQKMYDVYHIIVAEGYYAKRHGAETVRSAWARYLGQNVIILTDYTKLSEVIVSIIEVNEGRDAEEVAKSWDGDTAMVVRNAVTDLEAKNKAFDDASDVTRF